MVCLSTSDISFAPNVLKMFTLTSAPACSWSTSSPLPPPPPFGPPFGTPPFAASSWSTAELKSAAAAATSAGVSAPRNLALSCGATLS